MEIRYIWVKEFHGVFSSVDFNFQHQGAHSFSYNNGRLDLVENSPLVLDFGKNVRSVTAIAGRNGSGKSSLCELILHVAATYTNGGMSYYFPFNGIVCYGDTIFFAEGLPVENRAELEQKGYEVLMFKDTPMETLDFEDRPLYHKSSFIYYNNVLDWRADVRLHNLTNISTQYLVGDDYRTGTFIVPDFNDQSKSPDFFGSYYDAEGYRALKFYLQYHDRIPTSHPKQLVLRNAYSGNNRFIKIKDLFPNNYYSLFGLENKVITSIIDYPLPEGGEDLPIDIERSRQTMLRLYRLNLINTLQLKEGVEIDYNDVYDFVWKGEGCGKFFEENANVTKLLSLYRQIVWASEVRERYRKWEFDVGYQIAYQFGLVEYLWLDNIDEHRELVKAFLYLEQSLVNEEGGVYKRITNYALSHHQSSGERAYFSFFSRLYDAIQHFDAGYDKRENLVLFIDEGDGGFHPDWKRKFLKWVLDFLNSDFNQYKFQLILTTHSPYVLSDLTAENLLLLDKKDGKTTVVPREKIMPFGANINELLADAFFLNDGQIGDFARGKIQGVIDHLNRWRQLKERVPENWWREVNSVVRERCKLTIGHIGDSIVRKKLLDMYFELFMEEELLKREINSLESRLNELKKRRDDDRNQRG